MLHITTLKIITAVRSNIIVHAMRQLKPWLLFVSFIGILGFHSIPGLSQGRALTKAENAFNAGEYFSAIDLYKDAYGSLDKSYKADILFKMAECYRLINQPVKAEIWYIKAISKGVTNPLAVYYLGEMQKMNMKYEEAKESFKKFKELSPKDPRADDGIRSCELAQKWMDNPNGYQVDNMKFFNSRQEDFNGFNANTILSLHSFYW